MSGDSSVWLTDHTPVVVIQEGATYWRFHSLQEVLATSNPSAIPELLRRLERATQERGLYAAGYLSYEAGAAYDLATHERAPEAPPLAWFGLFAGREAIDLPDEPVDFRFGQWRAALSYETYADAIERIKAEIARGNTYQANFTFPLTATFDGDPWSLYTRLARSQRADYTAFIDLGRWVICSASPELFFRLDGDRITSRPMKGTASRGTTLEHDRQQRAWLRQSEKNRAENVMIVDMLRNDLGRVAAVGSVAVPDLFTVERYPSLLQMTSTVTARTEAALADICAAVFPCASITGAPKVRTMGILRDLEPRPRGIYTGAIGFVGPDRRAQFNVAIRTALIDTLAGRARYGVGSGIVWDSDAEAEYAECLLKARVLVDSAVDEPSLLLLESLRWTPGNGYYLFGRHLNRLAESAEYFGYALPAAEILIRLEALAGGLQGPSKVRLMLAADGQVTVEAEPLSAGARPRPLRVGLAAEPVSSANRFLYHKTTRRDVYEHARAGRPEYDDVILWNERGELTEATASNLLLEVDGEWRTPPVSSGLLAGTLRAHLLDAGEIVECVLTVQNLATASGIQLINSVRGRQDAVLFNVDESEVIGRKLA